MGFIIRLDLSSLLGWRLSRLLRGEAGISEGLVRGASVRVRRPSLFRVLLAAPFVAAPLSASDTTTYSYDALGRLITTAVTGGPSGGTQTSTVFDPAGNRSTYTVSGVPAPPAFSINSVSATEGAALVFTITKSGTSSGSVSVSYSTANGSASSPADYTAVSGTVTFLPSETTKTISVPTIDDMLVEGSETLTMTLSGPSAGTTIAAASGTGTGTINDNDSPPSFAIANAGAVTEGGTLTFAVSKVGAAAGSYSVNYASAGGTATSGADYTPVSGTLIFLSTETSKTITVSTIDDSAVESSETVLVNLSTPSSGATISAAQGSGTINDNDLPPPSFAISNAAAVAEGGTLVFTVNKTGIANTSFSVNYASGNGTATSGTDFMPGSGTLTFLASETSKTIAVQTIDDSSVESDETVLVNLFSPTGGATITALQGSGTIANNDIANLPPIANPDDTSFVCTIEKGVNVVANDTDPENNTPLTLVSVEAVSPITWASVLSSTFVQIGAAGPGTFTFNYVVSDSLGATSTGTLTAVVTKKQGFLCAEAPE